MNLRPSLFLLMFFTLLVGLIFWWNKKATKGAEPTSKETGRDIEDQDNSNLKDRYWHIDYDSVRNKEFLRKGRLMDSISLSYMDLIEILNKREARCRIQLKGIKKDTIIIRIREAHYLTERMGSTGAFCYLGETVYTLTEHDSVRFVKIEMEEGSHAAPGVYTRKDFTTLLEKEP